MTINVKRKREFYFSNDEYNPRKFYHVDPFYNSHYIFGNRLASPFLRTSTNLDLRNPRNLFVKRIIRSFYYNPYYDRWRYVVHVKNPPKKRFSENAIEFPKSRFGSDIFSEKKQ